MVGKLTPQNTLSASLTPVFLNASPYRTRNSLLHQFIQIDDGTFVDDYQAGEAAWWGNEFEGKIGIEAARRLGLTGLQLEFDHAFHHADLPFAASLDGLGHGHSIIETDVSRGIYVINAPRIDINGPGLLEIKNTSAMPENEPARHRGPLQGQAQLMCYPEARWLAVCVLYQGIELRIFLYHRDEVMQMQIRDAILDFERRRKERDYYPWTEPGDAVLCYSTTDGKLPPLDLDPDDTDAMIALEQLVLAKRKLSDAEEDIEDAQMTLMERMGRHETAFGMVGNQRVMLKWPMRKYRAQPEKIVPAKGARTVRQKTLTIKEIDQ
tara:strand:- start:5969 stop:6937 length:969 start_codon:yes stop_codon:yes gene_type:complete